VKLAAVPPLSVLETARRVSDYRRRESEGRIGMPLGGSSDLGQFRVQRHFADHRAFAPGDAIEYAPAGPVERRAFDQLRATGVIREAQPAYYWFDLDRMGHGRKRRRNPKKVIAIVLGIVLAILTILLARG
jgi:hypothetical protein